MKDLSLSQGFCKFFFQGAAALQPQKECIQKTGIKALLFGGGRFIFLGWLFFHFLPGFVFSASNIQSNPNQLTFITQEPQTFVIAPFDYEGISESAARSLEEKFIQYLRSASLFNVLTSQSLGLEDFNCTNFVCAQPFATKINADGLLVGKIKINEENIFSLKIDLFDSFSGKPIFQKNLSRKGDWEAIFQDTLTSFKQQIPILGEVTAVEEKAVTLNLGTNSGLSPNDRLIIFRPQSKNSNILADSNQNITKVVAVVEIQTLSKTEAEGKILYSVDDPKEKDKIQFLADPQKQQKSIQEARLAMDRQSKFPKTTPAYISRIPVVQDPTSDIIITKIYKYDAMEKENWIREVRYFENRREIYRWASVGSAAVFGLFVLAQTHPAVYLLPIGVGFYCAYTFLDARENWNRVVDEGKYRGFLDPQWQGNELFLRQSRSEPALPPNQSFSSFSPNGKSKLQLASLQIPLLHYSF